MLTDKEIAKAEKELAAAKREREHAKWDAELVGRYFRIARTAETSIWEIVPFAERDYVTLEESLAVGVGSNRYVYADVVYLHIQRRDDDRLVCSGFELNHAQRDEPYLKIQPRFYSYGDFRSYLGQWSNRDGGPAKHCDEIQAEEYAAALAKAVANFTKGEPNA